MSYRTANDYLAEHHVLYYLEDAIAQLLVYKDDMPKVDVNRFFGQYFQSLKDGNHTMLREYAFISATPYNRAAFIRLFYDSFANVGKKGDLLSIRDYFSLVSTLCPDFPYELLQKTVKIVLIEDAHDCLIAFTDFLYAFQLQLYYQEFLELSHHTYQALFESQAQSPRDIFVPTDHSATEHKVESKVKPVALSADGVDSTKFCRSLCQLQEKNNCSLPSHAVLKHVLSTTSTVTFYEFLVALAKSEEINAAIGKLPDRDKVFEGVELNLRGLQLHSGKTNPTVSSAASNTTATIPHSSSSTPSLRGTVDCCYYDVCRDQALMEAQNNQLTTQKCEETTTTDNKQQTNNSSKQTTPRSNSVLKKKEMRAAPIKRQRATQSLRRSKALSYNTSDSDSTDSSDTDT